MERARAAARRRADANARVRTALLRSLGDVPIAGSGDLASYFAAVVDRAASVATALALSAELPTAPPDTAADPPD